MWGLNENYQWFFQGDSKCKVQESIPGHTQRPVFFLPCNSRSSTVEWLHHKGRAVQSRELRKLVRAMVSEHAEAAVTYASEQCFSNQHVCTSYLEFLLKWQILIDPNRTPTRKLGCCLPPWELTEVREHQGALNIHVPEVPEPSFP